MPDPDRTPGTKRAKDTPLPALKPTRAGREQGAIPEAGLPGRAINATGILFALGIIASALILLNEVVLRYGFDSPTIWAHETTIFLCAMAFTYGGLYSSARNSHIRVVLLYDLARGRTKRVLDTIISVICLIASAFFASAAWTMVQKSLFRPDGSIHLETSGSAWDPPFPACLKMFLFATLCLMTLQFLVLAINYLRGKACTENIR